MASTRLGWGSALAVPFFLAGAVASHAAAAGPGRWAAGSVAATQPAMQPATQAIAQQPPAASGGGAGEVLAVTVQGAGLTAGPTMASVTLHRVGRSSRFTGSFGPLTVVDARGTLAGWTLWVASVGPLPSGALTVHPAKPVTVSGVPSEVHAAGPSKLGSSPVGVMTAAAGGGGGTFADSGTVDLESSAVIGDSATVQLSVSAP